MLHNIFIFMIIQILSWVKPRLYFNQLENGLKCFYLSYKTILLCHRISLWLWRRHKKNGNQILFKKGQITKKKISTNIWFKLLTSKEKHIFNKFLPGYNGRSGFAKSKGASLLAKAHILHYPIPYPIIPIPLHIYVTLRYGMLCYTTLLTSTTNISLQTPKNK